jgi:alanyl aminopeptidase
MSLLNGIQGAMYADSLVSARAIRQPIQSPHDIENAFDSITYQKGGGVLAMFEQWAGPDVWQKGLHAYLEAHRFGNATADDFLEAEDAATGKDVKNAFHTFLEQPGVPLVEVSKSCKDGKASVALKQSRYLPLGSSGEASRTWRLPVCVRAEGVAAPVCTVLTEAEGSLPLPGKSAAGPGQGSGRSETCPAWVFPNADAAGYFRFVLSPADLASLRAKGMGALTTREKVAFATSIQAAYARGAMTFKDALEAVAPLAADEDPTVAGAPMGYLWTARDWLFQDEKVRANVEAYGRRLYEPVARRLGWSSRPGESDEVRTLRARVVNFLALTAQDPAARGEARKRGLAYLGFGKARPVSDGVEGTVHEEAVDPNLAPVALGVVGEEADHATWDLLHRMLTSSVDETVRQRLLFGLASVQEPTLAAATRELMLDRSLRDNEIFAPLSGALGDPARRDAAWAWMKEHYDAILERLPRHHGGVALVGAGGVFCDEGHAKELESFFRPKIDGIEGGPRVLASTLEDMRLCAARRNVQEPSARALFARGIGGGRASSR